MTGRQLRADAVSIGPVSLMAEAAKVEAVDHTRRTITGLLVPYGRGGRTNLGAGLALRAGAVRFHEPARRVIGLFGHRSPAGQPPPAYPLAAPVSRMVGYTDEPGGLRIVAKVPATPLGDQLLAEADPQTGVRSMLSIELDDCVLDQWTGDIVAGLCEFYAHVPIGAYDDATVTSVAAQATRQGDDVRRSSPFQRNVIEVGGGQQPAGGGQPAQPAPAGDGAQWWLQTPPAQQQQQQQQPAQQPAQQQPAPQVLAWPQQQPAQLQAQQQQPAPVMVWPQPQQPAQVQLSSEQFQQLMAGAQPQQQQQPAGPAQLPGGLPTGAVPNQTPAAAKSGNVRKMAQLQAAMVNGQDSIQLRAALADITNTQLDLFQRPAGAIGEELWTGGGYQRRFVGLMAQKELTSWKFGGWRWTQRPEVDAYAGDKAPIPTNPVDVEPIEGTAERLAGGWDIDRKFRDFGDTAFWEGFYAAQTESYAEKSDLMAAAFIVDQALAITTNANVPAGYVGSNVAQADILRAAALGSAILEDTPNVRRPADYVLMNTADWLGLMDFTGLELPAFLAMLGVQPAAFQRTSEVPAGRIILGVKPALTFRELGGGAPIRVEALDVARAGIDSAVYGYVGFLNNRPGGVISVPLASAVTP